MLTTLLDRPALPADDATRRQFLIGGASLAGLFAGCSTAAPAPAPPPARTGFPVTITHKYGSVQIGKAPERVVAVGLTEQDALLALGVTPVATVEARFAEAQQANRQFAEATAIAAYDFGDGQLGVYGPQDPRARILTSLGFKVPPRIAELVGNEFYATISAEQLQLVEADVVIWIVYTEAGASRIKDQPVYRTLKVAQEGRDIFLEGTDPVGAAYAFSTVLSLPVALDGLIPRLVAALDGDPATTTG